MGACLRSYRYIRSELLFDLGDVQGKFHFHHQPQDTFGHALGLSKEVCASSLLPPEAKCNPCPVIVATRGDPWW